MIKKHNKSTPISKHMQSLGYRYNPKMKTLRSEKGQTMKKFGHGYFQLYSFDKQKITPNVKKFLLLYPHWIINQKQIKQEEFQFIFKIMLQAHPSILSIFQQKNTNINCLKLIEAIRFPYLKQIKIQFQSSINLESISWLQAPLLQKLQVSSKGVLSGLKPLIKCNYKNLKVIKVQNLQKQNGLKRNFDLTNISRIKMQKCQNKEKELYFYETRQINIFRQDYTDASILSKVEIQKLRNFSIPQLQPKKGVDSINMKKILETLNRKFSNETFYHVQRIGLQYGFLHNLDYLHQMDYNDDSDSDYGNKYWDYDQNGYDQINLGCPNHYDNWYDF